MQNVFIKNWLLYKNFLFFTNKKVANKSTLLP